MAGFALVYFFTFILTISTFVGMLLSIPEFERGLYEISTPPESKNTETMSTTSIVFVGDVMLSRFVDTLARREGKQYMFAKISQLLDESYVVGNFEGCLSKIKEPTLDTMRFPVNPAFLPVLAANGFTHVSLANNHAFDCGASELEETRAQFWEHGITAFGHPTLISSSSVAFITTNTGLTISLLGLHTLYQAYALSALEEFFILSSTSDFQIVYIHWGNEYEPLHSPAQEWFASELVRLGADLIIGHHPHVVQDVGFINGVPVFYSLGNFIFDQYFSQPVQQGLLLELTVEPSISIKLIPVTSEGRQSSPRPMEEDLAKDFLQKLSERSHIDLREMIAGGELVNWVALATSSEIAIMSR